MPENADQKNFELGHFSRSVWITVWMKEATYFQEYFKNNLLYSFENKQQTVKDILKKNFSYFKFGFLKIFWY